jgi:N-methylhydantoinase B
MIEQLHPVLYLARRHLPDGAGAGKFVGGTTIVPVWMPYGVEQIGQVITHGFGVAPQSVGISGGYPGVFYQAMIRRNTDVLDQFTQGRLPIDFSHISGETEIVGSMHKTSLGKTDVYYDCATTPAAGYGDPIEREPEQVLHDVVNFLVTEEGARQTYGVVFRKDKANRLVIDEVGTERRRREIKEARKRQGRLPKVRERRGEYSRTGNIQRMNEYLSIVESKGKNAIQCRCGYVLGPADQNYKEMLLVVESPARNVAPGIEVYGLAKEFVFREFCCPNCQVLVATEVARKDDPFVWDIQLQV